MNRSFLKSGRTVLSSAAERNLTTAQSASRRGELAARSWQLAGDCRFSCQLRAASCQLPRATLLKMELEEFLRPFYQDLDGASRFDEVERIARIARRIYEPANAADARAFELLLLFHRLGPWLEKVGNLSRTLLTVKGLSEEELRRTAASIRRLGEPVSEAERAVAAAILIDSAGVRGLTELFARAKREGSSLMDVLRAALSDLYVPEWIPEVAEEWLHNRREARRETCRRVLEELSLDA